MNKNNKHLTFYNILENKELNTAANKIAANVRFKDLSSPMKSIAVSSPTKNEGKTTVAISLAGCFADAGFRTLLVDTDIHQHSISHMFRNFNRVSAYDVFSGACSLENAIYSTEKQNLYFLDCVKSISSIPELLGTVEFNNMFNVIKNNFDRVIFDTPPVLPCIDGTMISAVCDGAIIVVRQYKTKKEEIVRLKEQMDIAHVNILGSVINFSDKSEYKYYDY